jgi:hypothetical protein
LGDDLTRVPGEYQAWALIPALALLVLRELGKYVARRRQETT